MKKVFIIVAILLATATTITIVSCKKDREENVSSKDDYFNNQQSENMDEYLLAFKNKLNSATKGGETMTLEQAQLDLSNLLNFDFGDASYATDVFKYDTIYVNLSTDNEMVDLYQLSVTYHEAFDQILTSYRSVDLEDPGDCYYWRIQIRHGKPNCTDTNPAS